MTQQIVIPRHKRNLQGQLLCSEWEENYFKMGLVENIPRRTFRRIVCNLCLQLLVEMVCLLQHQQVVRTSFVFYILLLFLPLLSLYFFIALSTYFWLSACLSLSLSIYLSIYQYSLSLSISLSPSLSPILSLSLCLFLSHTLSLPLSLSLSLGLNLSSLPYYRREKN